MKLYLHIIIVFLMACCQQLSAQNDNDATAAYKKESLNLVPLNESTRQQLSKKLLYETRKKPVKVKRQQNRPMPQQPPVDPASFDDILYYLLLFLVFLILIYVLFRYMAGDAPLFRQPVQRKRTIELSDIESNLNKADVDSFLKKSLEDKDYRLSIRLYYLAIIKQLSASRAINWAKDKTNGHYMREMRAGKHPAYNDFKKLTRIFEFVWYSNVQFDQGQFKEVSVDFKSFLNAINQS